MLSILCVTSGLERAEPFLEHFRDVAARLGAECVILRDGVDVHSKGYIESVLEEAIARTSGDYILRMDDDERISPAMLAWLEAREYEKGDHFTFPRVHFWRDSQSVIVEKYYFPDLQTRLSTRAKAGGRNEIHAASPFGGGEVTRVCIEHWVYLVKTYEERCATGVRYNMIRAGANGGVYRSTSIEDEHPEGLNLVHYNGGTVPIQGAMRHTGRFKVELTQTECDDIRWWHAMDLGNGLRSKGHHDPSAFVGNLHLSDLTGKTALDIGTWDGFYAYEMERRGAQVTAVDGHIWREWPTGRRGFDFAHAALDSKVEAIVCDPLDVDKLERQFDVVLFLGVLYHMRHPLLSLEKVAAVTKDLAIIETHIDCLNVKSPAMAFYEGSEIGNDPTNWFGPNPSAVCAMARAAGFRTAEVVSLTGRVVVHARK